MRSVTRQAVASQPHAVSEQTINAVRWKFLPVVLDPAIGTNSSRFFNVDGVIGIYIYNTMVLTYVSHHERQIMYLPCIIYIW